MSHNKLYSLIFISIMALTAVSCKDDDETTTLPSLNGKLSYNVPAYVRPETIITMTPKGVTHPEDKELGYAWKVTPTMTKYDTTRFENGLNKNDEVSDGSFTHRFSDTLKTYKVYCIAFAEGYTSTSDTKECVVVDGGLNKSITGLGIVSTSPSVTIEGRKFYYTTVAGTDWLRLNMDDDTAGAPYKNCKAMSDVFGRYYSYEEAMEICPEGWTLPSDEDWVALAKAAGAAEAQTHANIEGVAAALMGNGSFNGTRMWEYWPQVGDITNSTGLSALPTGYAMLGQKSSSAKEDADIDYSYPQAIFKGYEEYAAFWTSDAVEDADGMAYYRYMISTQPDLFIEKGDMKSFGASVRCVRRK